MSASEETRSDSTSAAAREFETTHWTVVLQAALSESSPDARQAINRLCRAYWYPLYAHVRRQGRSVQDAEDITQEFFARLLSHDYLKLADPQRGRFRTFLLTSLSRFMINDWRKANAVKRGGDAEFVSLDVEAAERRLQAEAVDAVSPERLFQKQWALTLLEQVFSRLGHEYAGAGKQAVFDGFRPHVLGETADETQAALATRLGMTSGAVRVELHRLRKRYGELLRHEVSRTVASPGEVDAELRELVAALRT